MLGKKTGVFGSLSAASVRHLQCGVGAEVRVYLEWVSRDGTVHQQVVEDYMKKILTHDHSPGQSTAGTRAKDVCCYSLQHGGRYH